MFVQEQWLCFEPILSTADIASKMETEGRLFKVRYKNSKTFCINALFGRLLHNKSINCIICAIKSSDGNTTHYRNYFDPQFLFPDTTAND